MSDDHEIIPVEAVAIEAPSQQQDLHPLVRTLVAQGDLTPETMQQLMDIQERHDAMVAERIFNDARARLLDDLPAVVAKNREVQYNGRKQYSYADLPQIMRAVMPALRKHGFNVSWTNAREERDEVVTCHLSHRCGHSATNTRRGTVESRKGQSAVQASQSTVTYLQRHSLLAILGIVTDDAPDADETPTVSSPPRPDAVDVKANMDLQRRLRTNGLSVQDAEGLAGSPCKEWTAEQVERVRQWARETIEARKGDDK